MTLLEDLKQLANEGLPLEGEGAIIVQQTKRGKCCLSGVPYLWTGFQERAFRFASRAQATDFYQRHHLNCEVEES